MTADLNAHIDHSDYKILIVDDVVSNVLLLKVLLKNEKFKTVTASDGLEAIQQAEKELPDQNRIGHCAKCTCPRKSN